MSKEKLYLSPSRAFTFLNCKRSFIQNYVFDCPPPEKATWATGTLYQDLVYAIIRGDQIKECANKKEHNKLKESNIFGIYGGMVSVHDELKAVLPLLIESNKGIEFEKHIVCDKMKAQGYVDILLPASIIEVKTSTGDLNNWDRANNMIRLGLQKYIYTNILNTEALKTGAQKRDYFILAVEATYPYRVEIKLIPDDWRDKCGELFLRIQTDYLKWIWEVGRIIQRITGHSNQAGDDDFWFGNAKNASFKKEIYKELEKQGHISLVKDVKISEWQVRELDNSL